MLGGLDNNSFMRKKCTRILKARFLEQFCRFSISRQFLYGVTPSCRIQGYSPCLEWFCTTKKFVVFLFLLVLGTFPNFAAEGVANLSSCLRLIGD